MKGLASFERVIWARVAVVGLIATLSMIFPSAFAQSTDLGFPKGTELHTAPGVNASLPFHIVFNSSGTTCAIARSTERVRVDAYGPENDTWNATLPQIVVTPEEFELSTTCGSWPGDGSVFVLFRAPDAHGRFEIQVWPDGGDSVWITVFVDPATTPTQGAAMPTDVSAAWIQRLDVLVGLASITVSLVGGLLFLWQKKQLQFRPRRRK